MAYSTQRIISWSVFALGVGSALFFALFTDHRWEDWYITFRASKNLSEGLGFTFNMNERVHSFTSPLGTLIPALLNFITRDDEAVIWSFRIINMLLIGLVVKLVFDLFRDTIKAPAWAALLVTLALVFDEKSIDFSINGMETAFMLLGVVLLIRELFKTTPPEPLRLGAIFAFLMWSRPDAFIHIGSLLLGYLLFKNGSWRYIGLFFKAGITGIVFYLPWVLFAWWYYGNPVPNTILAKGFTLTLSSIADRVLGYLQSVFMGLVSSEAPFVWIFAPAYFNLESWPVVLMFVLKCLTYIAVFLWVVPKINANARFLSFAAFLVASYLNVFSPTIYPWYIPAVMVIGLIGIGCAAVQPTKGGLLDGRRSVIAVTALSVILVAQLWVYTGGLLQMKSQQELIENGLRKKIGLWLKDEAKSPEETVFLEPLGYIGFYSGLTMYDYPGLCNTVVINARKKLKTESYVALINYLQPNWVVFRPWDLGKAPEPEAGEFAKHYELARTFSQKEQIKDVNVYGKNYLVYDSEFLVYKKK